MIGNKYILSPSLMCMSYLQIAHDVEVLNCYFDTLHVDISDGHFCKALTLSPDYIRELRQISRIPIEVHLMVDSPNDYIEQLVDAGANAIIVHIEAMERDAFRTINRIRSMGAKVGIALCPETPFAHLVPFLQYVDIISILNVDIGFVGQPLIPEMIARTRCLAELKRQHGYDYVIQSDGGVTDSTYRLLAEAGAESFVLGKKALFSKNSNLDDACKTMQQIFTRETSEVK